MGKPLPFTLHYHKSLQNKTIVGHTSPALCTSITPSPPLAAMNGPFCSGMTLLRSRYVNALSMGPSPPSRR